VLCIKREAAFKTLSFSVLFFNLFANLKGTTRERTRQKRYTLYGHRSKGILLVCDFPQHPHANARKSRPVPTDHYSLITLSLDGMLHEIMTALLNKAKPWLIQPNRKSCNHATQSATYVPVWCKLFPLRSLYTVQGHKHSKSVVASTNRQRVQSQRSVFAYYYPFLGTRVIKVGQYRGKSTTFTKQNINIT